MMHALGSSKSACHQEIVAREAESGLLRELPTSSPLNTDRSLAYRSKSFGRATRLVVCYVLANLWTVSHEGVARDKEQKVDEDWRELSALKVTSSVVVQLQSLLLPSIISDIFDDSSRSPMKDRPTKAFHDSAT